MTTQTLFGPGHGHRNDGHVHAEALGNLARQLHQLHADTITGSQLGALRDEVGGQIARLEEEVDALQVSVLGERRPWYKDGAVVISVLTFLFSLATTLFAYAQSYQQSIQADRVALRDLVQRLSDLPHKNAELTRIYTDTLVIGQLSGHIQAENALLAKQAAEIIRRIPEHTSAAEYVTVAVAMNYSGLLEQSLKLYHMADGSIEDANDGVAIYRGQASNLYALGRIEEGAEAYRKALAIFQEFPTPNRWYEARTHGLTELQWALAELGQMRCEEARRHLAEADRHLATLPDLGVPEPIKLQADQARHYVERCGQGGGGVPQPAPLP